MSQPSSFFEPWTPARLGRLADRLRDVVSLVGDGFSSPPDAEDDSFWIDVAGHCNQPMPPRNAPCPMLACSAHELAEACHGSLEAVSVCNPVGQRGDVFLGELAAGACRLTLASLAIHGVLVVANEGQVPAEVQDACDRSELVMHVLALGAPDLAEQLPPAVAFLRAHKPALVCSASTNGVAALVCAASVADDERLSAGAALCRVEKKCGRLAIEPDDIEVLRAFTFDFSRPRVEPRQHSPPASPARLSIDVALLTPKVGATAQCPLASPASKSARPAGPKPALPGGAGWAPPRSDLRVPPPPGQHTAFPGLGSPQARAGRGLDGWSLSSELELDAQ